MSNQEYVFHLAGADLILRPRFPDTIRYVDPKYYTPAPTADPSASRAHVIAAGNDASDAQRPDEQCSSLQTNPAVCDPAVPPVVHIPDRDWADYLAEGMEDCAHTEYSVLTAHFSDALLAYDRVIIHGVAIRWHDEAWLICAPSGTGKSTQAKHLQALRPGEFSIICGDRPVLEFRPASASPRRDEHCSSGIRPECNLPQANPASPAAPAVAPVAAHTVRQEPNPRTAQEAWEITVHPSPWNGKENWYGADAAPLAGLILLERGEENRLVALEPKEAALPLYPQFIQTAWEPDNIRKIAELETRLLQTVPIWRLTTFRVPDSTQLLLEAVF